MLLVPWPLPFIKTLPSWKVPRPPTCMCLLGWATRRVSFIPPQDDFPTSDGTGLEFLVAKVEVCSGSPWQPQFWTGPSVGSPAQKVETQNLSCHKMRVCRCNPLQRTKAWKRNRSPHPHPHHQGGDRKKTFSFAVNRIPFALTALGILHLLKTFFLTSLFHGSFFFFDECRIN